VSWLIPLALAPVAALAVETGRAKRTATTIKPSYKTVGQKKSVWSEMNAPAAYMAALEDYPLLTKEEEVELAQALEARNEAKAELVGCSEAERPGLLETIEKGDEAHEKFVFCNLRLVLWYAMKVRIPTGATVMDMVQNGNMGLLYAVQKFDWRKGVRFSTYAIQWIRAYIHRGKGVVPGVNDRMIRLPEHMEFTISQMQREIARSISEGSLPSTADLAAKLKEPESKIEQAMEWNRMTSVLSFDSPFSDSAPLPEGGQRNMLHILPSTVPDPEKVLFESELQQYVATLLTTLHPKEADVLTVRYGFDGTMGKSRPQSARALGISTKMLTRVESQALSRLRRENSASLRQYNEEWARLLSA
jgi:RNA polymerase primary sigma factor